MEIIWMCCLSVCCAAGFIPPPSSLLILLWLWRGRISDTVGAGRGGGSLDLQGAAQGRLASPGSCWPEACKALSGWMLLFWNGNMKSVRQLWSHAEISHGYQIYVLLLFPPLVAVISLIVSTCVRFPPVSHPQTSLLHFALQRPGRCFGDESHSAADSSSSSVDAHRSPCCNCVSGTRLLKLHGVAQVTTTLQVHSLMFVKTLLIRR